MIRHYVHLFVFSIAVGLATIVLVFAIGASRALARGRHVEVCHFAIKHGQLEVHCHEKRKPKARSAMTLSNKSD